MDESDNISRRTWNRNIATVNKIGYMDGASDGQKLAFQSSFDLGYKQGFNLGFELGLKKGMSLSNTSEHREKNFGDPRDINCQVCLNVSSLQHNVGNMYNTQQEKNIESLCNLNTIKKNQTLK